MANVAFLDRLGDGIVGALIAGGVAVAVRLIRPRRAQSEERSDVAGRATALSESLMKRVDQLQVRLDQVDQANEECEAHRKACEDAVEELTHRVRKLERERPPSVFPSGSEVGI